MIALLLIDAKVSRVRRIVDRTVGPWYEFSQHDEQLRANLEYFRRHGDEQAESATSPRSASASAFERIALDLSLSHPSQT